MSFVRAIAIFLLIAAVLCVGAEAINWIASGRHDTLTAGELWLALDHASLRFAEAIISEVVAPWVWDPVLLSTLTLPAWSILGAPALFLMWYAEPRPHPHFLRRRRFFGLITTGGTNRRRRDHS